MTETMSYMRSSEVHCKDPYGTRQEHTLSLTLLFVSRKLSLLLEILLYG